MKKQPKPHQIEACDFLVRNNGRAINGDVPGLGKTLASIMYMQKLDKWPCLVVCPSSVKGHWAKEFGEFTGHKAVIVEGTAPYEGTLDHELAIINYDILAAQMPWLTEQNFEVIVFDECHALANTQTKWTKAARILAKRCARVQGLSGTPIANRPSDFWPILNMIRPDLFSDFNAYAWEYCAPRFHEKFGRWEYKGATNMDKLHALVKPFMLRRGKEVLNLPQQSLSVQFVEMDNREIYDALHKQYLDVARRPSFGRNKGLEKLTLLQNLLMLVARCKARSTVHWIRDYLKNNPQEKLIAFCTHTPMLDVIYRRAAAEGEAIFINGSVSSAKRTNLIEQFQTNPSCRLAVCNIKAAGAGITLTAATKSVVAELPWTSKDVTQIMGRNHRIGQTRETEMIFLLTQGTIEEKLCKVIQEKQAIHEAIIEGKKLDDLPLHKLLEQELTKQ